METIDMILISLVVWAFIFAGACMIHFSLEKNSKDNERDEHEDHHV